MYLLFQWYSCLDSVSPAMKKDKNVETVQERCRSHKVADCVAKLHKYFLALGPISCFICKTVTFVK